MGYSVSLSSNGSIVTGVPQLYDNSTNGYVQVYQYNPTGGGEGAGAWEQLGDNILGEANDDEAGWSVSLSSDGTIVAMVLLTMIHGQVRIYQYNPDGGGEGAGAWEQLGDEIDGVGFQERAGYSVSLNNNGNI